MKTLLFLSLEQYDECPPIDINLDNSLFVLAEVMIAVAIKLSGVS